MKRIRGDLLRPSQGAILIWIWLLAVTDSDAQELRLSADVGSGMSYLVEDLQSEDILDYSPSLAFKLGLDFRLADQHNYLGLELSSVNSTFRGDDLLSSYWDPRYGHPRMTGIVSTQSFGLYLRHLNDEKRIALGYSFGGAMTYESFSVNRYTGPEKDIRLYPSLIVDGIASVKLGQKLRINLTPRLFWTDPLNSFRPQYWLIAGEDLSVLGMIGVTYLLTIPARQE